MMSCEWKQCEAAIDRSSSGSGGSIEEHRSMTRSVERLHRRLPVGWTEAALEHRVAAGGSIKKHRPTTRWKDSLMETNVDIPARKLRRQRSSRGEHGGSGKHRSSTRSGSRHRRRRQHRHGSSSADSGSRDRRH
jgi:hypothetical protein